MGRILGIDYGRKRVGVAVTDPLQMIANGLDTFSSSEIFNFLENYFRQEEVELVVVGYPKRLNNTDSEAVRYVKEFISQFEKKFPDKKYFFIEERFTSKMAFQAMIDGGLRKKQRQNKAMVDKISAVIILQSYLEMKANNPNFR